jgi:hypothetical protein
MAINKAIPTANNRTAIGDIAQHFGIPKEFLPVMQRAMTTRSYSGETKTRSGAALAQLGAHVLGLVIRLFIVEELLRHPDLDREKDAALLAAYLLKAARVSQVWELLPFEKAMLCSKSFVLTDATRSDLIQAVFGAALIAHGSPDALLPFVPGVISNWIRVQLISAVRTGARLLNPKSALQAWCLVFGFEYAYNTTVSCPCQGRNDRSFLKFSRHPSQAAVPTVDLEALARAGWGWFARGFS